MNPHNDLIEMMPLNLIVNGLNSRKFHMKVLRDPVSVMGLEKF
jgi:hypothetical protein